MSIYDVNGNELDLQENQKDIVKISAHRGYYANSFQNTVDSIIKAYENGFRWCEIDLYKCADGVYVLSHNNPVTLYNNGTSVSVNFTSSNYSTIKNYTWDSAGEYRLSTLQSALGMMKLLGMHMICDRKSGSNADIVSIASKVGATDCLMLYYTSPSSAISDATLLNKYPYIPLRMWPSNYSDLQTLMQTVTNPIYSDMTPSDSNANALAIALACGLPMIYADCTEENANRWVPLANGCMAQGSNNISYSTFKNLMNINYDKVATLTAVDSASVSVGSTISITATSDLDEYAGYVFGYSVNPLIATSKQTAWGASASITITGVSSGTTTLRFFTASGTIKDVTITVS